MNVCVIQLKIDDGESKSERIGRVEGLLDSLNETDLIVLPELWNIGYFSFDRYIEEAEKIGGETISRMREKARELKTYLLAGSIIEREGNYCYNTSVFLNPSGETEAIYRKLHLWGHGSKEDKILSPGEKIVTSETDYGTVGISTCYDLRFPETYRKQVEKGAGIFLVSAAWPQPRIEDWELLNRTRALENQSFLISANSAGKNRGRTFLGRSKIIDPRGKVKISGGEGGEILRKKIDPKNIEDVRSSFPFLKDRRSG